MGYCFTHGFICEQEAIEVGEVRLRRSAELREDEARAEEVLQRISEQK
jgi:hypothetical protein